MDMKNLPGIIPPSLFKLRSTVDNFVKLPDRDGKAPIKELLLSLRVAKLLNWEVMFGKFPKRLLELKSKNSNGVSQLCMVDMSPLIIFLLTSSLMQFPRELGNDPDMRFEERFKLLNVVELISGIEPEKT